MAALRKFKASPGQEVLWKSDKRLLLGVAGAQGGKTSFGCIWLLREIQRFYGRNYNYVVVCPTYKVMNQSVIPTFLQVCVGLNGQYNKQENTYSLGDGGKVFFRSATDPDSVIGTPNVKAGYIDECGKVPRAAYYAVVERCARLQGRILLTTTPYALNWVVKDIIFPFDRKERDDITYVRWRSVDNPTYPKEEYERLRHELPSRIFRMRYEGYHDKAEGLIFEDWDDSNWCDPFQLPPGTKVYGGCDWGFDHAMALVVRAITPDKNCYTISIFKKSGLGATQQLDVIEAKTKMFHVEHWAVGHDRPEQTLDLTKRRIQAFPYFQINPTLREVNAGNAKHAELVKSKRLRCFKGLDQWQELEDEYQTYVWDKDESQDDRGKEKPVNENDDLMAAERYCTVGSCHLLTRKAEPLKLPLGWETRIDRFRPNQRRRSIDDY
jgi:Terminase large subunit, T4likevirus-type, N-terminal/Terminase RNaseH-like domain